MVEGWIVDGFMIWRIQIVWIYEINMGKQAKYCELSTFGFPQFLVHKNLEKVRRRNSCFLDIYPYNICSVCFL